MTVQEAVKAARDRGAHPHVLRGEAVTTRHEAMEAIAAALSFPEWFGHNLDALYDSLTDLSWLPPGEHVLIWPRPAELARNDPRGHDSVSAVLEDAVRRTAELGDRVLTVVRTD
ncbi:barstar family protein [Umezawaea sp. Da 62-37]|uniref:barstar family protein n=1 Tax=Umezawaea sp. Da 62-37 TaxID=3075927 RepID=UPI0028F747FF|nr:barstar family protein [Umezawaea sp. Da 62-37]WNV83343.1 barstar family protein [Umezawaea sp. Da 62-37]